MQNNIDNDHQLNGYKFSFNRVNPYFRISQGLEDRVINQENYQENVVTIKFKESFSKEDYEEIGKQQESGVENKQEKKILQTEMGVNKIQHQTEIKHNQSTKADDNKTSSSKKLNYKNTKQMFYNTKTFKQNQKNRMLMQLYLRKTRFIKSKNSKKSTIQQPKQIKSMKQINQLSGGSPKQSKKIIAGNKNNLDLSMFINSIRFSETKESRNVEEKSKKNKDLSIQIGSGISKKDLQQQNNQKDGGIKSERKIDLLMKSNKSGVKRRSKSFKNFLSNKFIAYTQVSIGKEKSKISLQKPTLNSNKQLFLKTKNPIKNNPSFLKYNTHSISEIASDNLKSCKLQTQQTQPVLKNFKNPSKIKNITSLTIKTQSNQQDYLKPPFYQHPTSTKLLTSRQKNKQKFKLKEQSIRKKLGALKYRTPKVYLNQKYTMFKSEHNQCKIKLFTQVEEQNIIKQFYTQRKKQNQQQSCQQQQ